VKFPGDLDTTRRLFQGILLIAAARREDPLAVLDRVCESPDPPRKGPTSADPRGKIVPIKSAA